MHTVATSHVDAIAFQGKAIVLNVKEMTAAAFVPRE